MTSKTIIAVALLATLFQIGSCIKCYQCGSVAGGVFTKCEGEYNKTLNPCSENQKVCQKLVLSSDDSDDQEVRQCGESADACDALEEKDVKDGDKTLSVACYACDDEDACNSASDISPSFVIIPTLISISLLFAKH